MKKIAVLNEFSIEAVRDVLQKLEDFPKLVVNGLNAFQLNEIKKIDPLLFNSIGKKIEEGRWFPEVGLWCGENEKISDERLIRNALYSAEFFKDNFGKKFRVFHCDTICNNALAQIVYNAEFDACYIKDEKEAFWLDGAADTRTLVSGKLDTVDVNDITDDFINENDFGSIEDEVIGMYKLPIDLKTCRPDYEASQPAQAEKLLLDAEKIGVQNGENLSGEIKKLWLKLFMGEDVTDEAEKLIGGRKADDKFLRIDTDEAQLSEMKFAEDGSSDVVIRIKETAGTEKTLFVMCDPLDAGFRCEILPYEIQTFRIDKDGFVKEIFIVE